MQPPCGLQLIMEVSIWGDLKGRGVLDVPGGTLEIRLCLKTTNTRWFTAVCLRASNTAGGKYEPPIVNVRSLMLPTTWCNENE